MSTTIAITFAEFLDLPELEAGKRELLEGEVITLPPAKWIHAEIARRIARILETYAASAPGISPDQVYQEVGYRIGHDPDSWLQPDVSVSYPDQPHADYFEGAPMLAVEVVSERNTADEIERKRKQYLKNGGREVWVVFHRARTVWVYNEHGAVHHEHNLQSALLPGLLIRFETLFG